MYSLLGFTFKHLLCAVLFIILTLFFKSASVSASLNSFPAWKLTSLSGQPVDTHSFKKPTVVIVGFKYQQQSAINPWVKAILSKPAVDIHEIAFVPAGWKKHAPRIEPFMRSRLPSAQWKNFVSPLYGEKPIVMRALGVSNESDIYLYLVGANGHIIGRTQGGYTQAKLSSLLSGLTP